jgi:hypothetical protein
LFFVLDFLKARNGTIAWRVRTPLRTQTVASWQNYDILASCHRVVAIGDGDEHFRASRNRRLSATAKNNEKAPATEKGADLGSASATHST